MRGGGIVRTYNNWFRAAETSIESRIWGGLLLFITGLFVARTAFARLIMNTVVGLARSSINGQATDAHQWLVNVTLFRE